MSPSPTVTTLIATLGSEPQVVTITHDLLARLDGRIGRVVVVHTLAPGGPMALALERLRAEFSSDFYPNPPDVITRPIHWGDVDSGESVREAFGALYRAVRAEKLAGRRVHLSIAGGRKSMAVFGMAAAQMLFDEGDRLWHLVSEGELLETKRMHPDPGDRVRLVEIPVILWGAVSPVLTDLRAVEDPFEAAEKQRALRIRESLAEARAFMLGALTPAERGVVELLVQEGLSDAAIAGRLGLSPRTIEQHLRSAYRKAAAHWDLPDVNRTQLAMLVHLFSVVQP